MDIQLTQYGVTIRADALIESLVEIWLQQDKIIKDWYAKPQEERDKAHSYSQHPTSLPTSINRALENAFPWLLPPIQEKTIDSDVLS